MPSIPVPQFPSDDGSADPELAKALDGYAEGAVGAQDVLDALSGARLLVPVVAVLTEGGLRGEKTSDMATPTLIGEDGRRAVLGFTSAEAMRAWRPDARPVAVHARQAVQAAAGEGADALVVDVAGPVPFVVELTIAR